MDSAKLREERARLVNEARAALKTAEDDNRPLTAEEQEGFDRRMAGVDDLAQRIERIEKIQAYDAGIDQEPRPTVDRRSQSHGAMELRDTPAMQTARREAHNRAFDRWLRSGPGNLEAEDRQIMASRFGDLPVEIRAQQIATDAAGGYLVPEDFSNELEASMLAYGGMMDVARVVTTSSGADLPWPTVNDTGNVGELLAEGTQISEQDMTFGVVTLGAYMYSSDLIRVSFQLLQDSAFDVGAFLREKLAERLARILNTHFTTGTGSGQPNGVVTASTAGASSPGSSATTIVYADLLDTVHDLDPAYRRNARWMFHDGTLKILRSLVDGDSRPLWQPGLAVREPDTILGYPYSINQDVATVEASAKSLLFGDFSKYIVRRVRDVQLLRLSERYADYFQVGFVAFCRYDGDLIDAGTDPVIHSANAAS